MANGIPGLLNAIANISNQVSLAVADGLLIYQKFQQPSWGIYNAGGGLAIIPDSIVRVDYEREWAIASYPQEQGAFQNYNKVQIPFENRVQITKGGSIAEKKSFIDALESIAASLDLFDIITPEQTFFNVNVYKIEASRSADSGASLLIYDVLFQEIRISATANFADTKNPNSANPTALGTVQPQISSAITPSPI